MGQKKVTKFNSFTESITKGILSSGQDISLFKKSFKLSGLQEVTFSAEKVGLIKNNIKLTKIKNKYINTLNMYAPHPLCYVNTLTKKPFLFPKNI